MARQVHLVGSVGLRDAETVFTTVSVMLGSCCPRIPDGETGERGYWIRWQRNTFARNLGFEEVMTTRSLPGFNDNVARTFFTLRKDTDPEKIELASLGTRAQRQTPTGSSRALSTSGKLPLTTGGPNSMPGIGASFPDFIGMALTANIGWLGLQHIFETTDPNRRPEPGPGYVDIEARPEISRSARIWRAAD